MAQVSAVENSGAENRNDPLAHGGKPFPVGTLNEGQVGAVVAMRLRLRTP